MQPLSILYEDNHLLAVNKAAGVAVQGGTGIEDPLVAQVERDLIQRYQKPNRAYVGLVHRLDKGTTGVVLLAKTSKAAARLSRAFQRDEVEKVYHAIVCGHPPEAGTLADELAPAGHGSKVVPAGQGKAALLHYRRCAQGPELALLEVVLVTGRKHQVRVQMAAAGWPLAGDRRYGGAEVGRLGGRPALHASRLGVLHPTRREPLSLVAPFPADMLRLARAHGLQLPRLPEVSVMSTGKGR